MLFDKDDYVGGHALTDGTGLCEVDLGFQVIIIKIKSYFRIIFYLWFLSVAIIDI